MLAVGSVQTQLPLSSRCHLRGTRHSRHGTRPWPTFLATPTPGLGPDARRGRRGLAASEGRGAAPSPLPCALCHRRPRLARASDALSSLCPLSATRLSLHTETHTPGRAGGECGNAQGPHRATAARGRATQRTAGFPTPPSALPAPTRTVPDRSRGRGLPRAPRALAPALAAPGRIWGTGTGGRRHPALPL